MNYTQNHSHQPPGQVYADYTLERIVKELLHSSKALDASDLTVTAMNGNITLSGTVKSDKQKNSAGSLAQLVHGVGNIKNDIIVKINEGILPTDVGRDD